MARTNPRIEHLERENAALRKMLNDRRLDPGEYPLTGCGDNSCIVLSGFASGGQRTNGGCRCEVHALRRGLAWWRRKAEFLEETIRHMKIAEVEDKVREMPLRAAHERAKRELLNWRPCTEKPPEGALLLVLDEDGALFVADHDGEHFVELAYGPRLNIDGPKLWCEVDFSGVEEIERSELRGSSTPARDSLARESTSRDDIRTAGHLAASIGELKRMYVDWLDQSEQLIQERDEALKAKWLREGVRQGSAAARGEMLDV